MRHLPALLVLSMSWATALCQPDDPAYRMDASNIGLAPGAEAPDFERLDQARRKQNLASLMGSEGLALVFFRSADW